MSAVICYVGLGSNMQNPSSQLRTALTAINRLPNSHIERCSWFYASKPMGPSDQPDYVNAVVAIRTQLPAETLLTGLQQIELEQGRVRKRQRWGPRTLDLDILLFGDLSFQTQTLTVPHYGMKERDFVLYPLYQIAPELILPCGNSLVSVLQDVSGNDLEVVEKDVNWE